LYDGFGNFLKWGISFNPATRYTGPELEALGGAPLPSPILQGPRKDMLKLERLLRRRSPGPLNFEKGVGCDWNPSPPVDEW